MAISSTLSRFFSSSKASLSAPGVSVAVRKAHECAKPCNFHTFAQFPASSIGPRATSAAWANTTRISQLCSFKAWQTLGEARRAFSSEADKTVEAASKDLLKTIQSEIQHEQSTYEQDEELKKYLQTSGWNVSETESNMMVTLQKKVGNKKVVVEFSCVQSAEAPTEEGPMPEMSDFTVTITDPEESGVTFYCSTTQDEEDKFRYCIGQVRFFNNAEEKESLSVYPGPYFEDLDDSFQQSLDEWLSKMGVDPELCDFIDRFSVDKENREYMAWLKKLAKFVEN